MPNHLQFPFLGLLLLVAVACSKHKDLEPAASLEGTWVQTRLTEYVPCSNCTTQRFIQDVTYPAGAHTLSLTPSEYLVYDRAEDTTYAFSYVRRGDTLLVRTPLDSSPYPSRVHIIELKARSLHLQRYVPRSGSSAILDQYFTR